MPMIEVDEAELARYRQITGFVQTALNNPKTRRKILEADKALNPDKAIPELDAADPLHDELKSIREEIQKDRDERKAEADAKKADDDKASWDRQWSRGQQKLRDLRVSDEAIGEIEKLMTDRNIVDHEAGLALFEKMHPAPPPVMNGSSRFGFFDGAAKDEPDVKMLLDQNYDDFLGQAIDKARADFRANGQ
jgi:hypothetical protein